MNPDLNDEPIKKFFRHWREEDAAHTPPFDHVIRAAQVRPGPSARVFTPWKLAMAGSLAVALLAAVWWLRPNDAPSSVRRPQAARSRVARADVRGEMAAITGALLTQWQAPTDFLLQPLWNE